MFLFLFLSFLIKSLVVGVDFKTDFEFVMGFLTRGLDVVVGPVLANGTLAPFQLPLLHFSEDSKMFKPPHRNFRMYSIIRSLESSDNTEEFGYKVFAFYYRVVVHSFLTLPFMGADEHEVVEVVWNNLEVHPEWIALCQSYGYRDVYLFVNYVVRCTAKKNVKARKFYYLNLYNEYLPNKLQSIVFKVRIAYSIYNDFI